MLKFPRLLVLLSLLVSASAFAAHRRSSGIPKSCRYALHEQPDGRQGTYEYVDRDQPSPFYMDTDSRDNNRGVYDSHDERNDTRP